MSEPTCICGHSVDQHNKCKEPFHIAGCKCCLCKKFSNILHDTQKCKTGENRGKRFVVLPGFQFAEFVGKVGTVVYYGFPDEVVPVLRFDKGQQVAIPERYLDW